MLGFSIARFDYQRVYIALVAFKLNVPSDENESWTLWAYKSLEQC